LLTSAAGQFTYGQCQTLGSSINLLYSNSLYFTCTSYTNSAINIVADNVYGSQATINTLFHDLIYNTTALKEVSNLKLVEVRKY
jgi:hypothetical protein